MSQSLFVTHFHDLFFFFTPFTIDWHTNHHQNLIFVDAFNMSQWCLISTKNIFFKNLFSMPDSHETSWKGVAWAREEPIKFGSWSRFDSQTSNNSRGSPLNIINEHLVIQFKDVLLIHRCEKNLNIQYNTYTSWMKDLSSTYLGTKKNILVLAWSPYSTSLSLFNDFWNVVSPYRRLYNVEDRIPQADL